MIPSKTKDKDEPAKGARSGETPTQQAATKAEAQAGLTRCLATLPVTEGYLAKVVEYVAAGV